jgi:hypothetical protein
VTGGPPSSSSSARGTLDLVVQRAAYAAMRLGLGQNSHGEIAPCRGNPTNSWSRRTLVDLFQKSQPNHEDWSCIWG